MVDGAAIHKVVRKYRNLLDLNIELVAVNSHSYASWANRGNYDKTYQPRKFMKSTLDLKSTPESSFVVYALFHPKQYEHLSNLQDIHSTSRSSRLMATRKRSRLTYNLLISRRLHMSLKCIVSGTEARVLHAKESPKRQDQANSLISPLCHRSK
jgi:hypothetical protein